MLRPALVVQFTYALVYKMTSYKLKVVKTGADSASLVLIKVIDWPEGSTVLSRGENLRYSPGRRGRHRGLRLSRCSREKINQL